MSDIKLVINTDPIVLRLSDGFGTPGPAGRGVFGAEIVDGTLEFTYDQAPFSQNVGQVVGRGITDANIVGNDLVLSYSQAPMTENVGRVVGDRYATTSTSSITVPNPNQSVTFTVGVGLAYTPQQSVIVANDGVAHFHGTVTSYNANTGVMVVQCTNRTGTGTYNTWTVNLTGAVGTAGNNGWSPTFAVVTDGARRVLQVVDWQGGTGTKPATGLYVGATGLVADIAQGVDVRGSVGPAGPSDFLPFINLNAYYTHCYDAAGWAFANTSGGSISIIDNPLIGSGVWRASVNTSPDEAIARQVAAGIRQIYLSANVLRASYAVVFTGTINNTQVPIVLIGLFNNIAGGAPGTDAVFFGATAVGSNIVWTCVTRTGAVSTTTTTTVNITAAQYALQFRATTTSVQFYINGVLVATHTTNIPTATTALQQWLYLRKSTGTGVINMFIDAIEFQQPVTSNYLWP